MFCWRVGGGGVIFDHISALGGQNISVPYVRALSAAKSPPFVQCALHLSFSWTDSCSCLRGIHTVLKHATPSV